MKFALIGSSIQHSRSPELYRQLLGDDLDYELLDFSSPPELPTLEELAKHYNGVNITSPFKKFYFGEVHPYDQLSKQLGAINTLSFADGKVWGVNTDIQAVRVILERFTRLYPRLHLMILGSGVMASLTKFVAAEFKIPLLQICRSRFPHMEELDLTSFEKTDSQNLVINACSRDFQFRGRQSSNNLFWDFNYSFFPHQNTLPFKVKEYHDGQELLLLQAKAAVEFWRITNPKLKC